MNKAIWRSALELTLASAVVAALRALWETHDLPPPVRLPWEELVPLVLEQMLLPAAAIGVALAIVAWIARRRRAQRAQALWQRPWLSATVLVVVTLLLFFTVSGFHHMFAFGVLGYMTADCDSPPEELPIPWGHCGIRGDAILLAVTVVAWLAFMVGFALVIRRLRPASSGAAPAR